MKKQRISGKLSLNKSVIHTLERTEAGQVLGGENTSRNADISVPVNTTVSIALPLTIIVSIKPAKAIDDASADAPPVCTGR